MVEGPAKRCHLSIICRNNGQHPCYVSEANPQLTGWRQVGKRPSLRATQSLTTADERLLRLVLQLWLYVVGYHHSHAAPRVDVCDAIVQADFAVSSTRRATHAKAGLSYAECKAESDAAFTPCGANCYGPQPMWHHDQGSAEKLEGLSQDDWFSRRSRLVFLLRMNETGPPGRRNGRDGSDGPHADTVSMYICPSALTRVHTCCLSHLCTSTPRSTSSYSSGL